MAGLLLVAAVNILLFPWIIGNAERQMQSATGEDTVGQSQVNILYHGAYVLYAEQKDAANELGTNLFTQGKDGNGAYQPCDYLAEWSDEFEQYRSALDYYATDGEHTATNTDADLAGLLSEGASETDSVSDGYAGVVVLTFDADGVISVSVVKSENYASDTIIKAFIQADHGNEIRSEAAQWGYTFVPVSDFCVVYGFSADFAESSLSGYYEEIEEYSDALRYGGANSVYFISLAVVVAFAFVMTEKRIWKTEKAEDCFLKGRFMELGVCGLAYVFMAQGYDYLSFISELPKRTGTMLEWWKSVQTWEILRTSILVFAYYGVVFASVLAIRPLFSVGPGEYIRRYSFLYQIFPWIKEKWRGFCGEVHHIDFGDKTVKLLLKIVLINFAVLAVFVCMWAFGLIGLAVYSVALFFILKRYYEKIAADYRTLMKATSRIADGDLDAVITEDIGVFEPFKAELAKIRTGFKKAVDEEVKSQRMKTELITNVSHDLKTPLTAITTYVALLKNEDLTDEERRAYIGTLEKKALRLKVLIEDLFEVSKATSNNITLNLMDVDVVNLLKQVSIEHAEAFGAQNLQVKWDVPDEKVVLRLDNQKTYRIFENLFVNVQKYAMPGSRVYLSVGRRDGEVVVTMKNMSQAELFVRGDELTERFVRGDSSRGTEGSGLGLAIAKSFTEAQKGTFAVSVDGDLFKVVITWKSATE